MDLEDMYYVVENTNVFNGDFDKFLLDIGVEHEHIEKMKTKVLQENKDDYYNFKSLYEDDSEMRLVPLNKVIGTSRGTIGESVYENVRRMKRGERETSRFKGCFSFLQNMSLDELKKSYQNLGNFDPVCMDFYLDDDQYYLTTGNHRTLTAMLLGAPYIRARVRTGKCDYEMKEKVIRTKQLFQKYSIAHIYPKNHGHYEIEFVKEGKCYRVDGFSSQKEGEGCFETIERLEQEIQNDLKMVETVGKLPTILRKIVLFFCDKERIENYFKPVKESTEWYPYKREVMLYKL